MIEVNNQVKARVSLKFIERVLNRALRKLRKKANISVALVGRNTIRKLNKRYRRLDRVTDVLSFNFDTRVLGEIIICYPQAKKQAERLKHSIREELKILLIHGLLHLLGYEHETKKRAVKMKKMQEKLC